VIYSYKRQPFNNHRHEKSAKMEQMWGRVQPFVETAVDLRNDGLCICLLLILAINLKDARVHSTCYQTIVVVVVRIYICRKEEEIFCQHIQLNIVLVIILIWYVFVYSY
jgi:hypothetical protein